MSLQEKQHEVQHIGGTVFVVMMDVDPEHEDEFNWWYNDEHLPERLGIPGLIASDAAHDVIPSGYDALDLPIHQVGIVAMGLWLLDNANFDDLVVQCEALGRWDFMFTMAALRFPTVTGSPVTPLATF